MTATKAAAKSRRAARAAELLGRPEGQRDGRGADQRRQRAQIELADAKELFPGPGERVEKGRAPLEVSDQMEGLGEARRQHPDRRRLVVIEALNAERGEPDAGPARRDNGKDPQITPPHEGRPTHVRSARLPTPGTQAGD